MHRRIFGDKREVIEAEMIPDTSRAQDLQHALRRVIADLDEDLGYAERFELKLLPSGELTYRVHLWGAAEYVGGYVAPE